MHPPEIIRVLNLAGLLLGFAGTAIIWRNSAPAGGQAPYWMDEALSQEIARCGAAAQRGLRLGLALVLASLAGAAHADPTDGGNDDPSILFEQRMQQQDQMFLLQQQQEQLQEQQDQIQQQMRQQRDDQQRQADQMQFESAERAMHCIAQANSSDQGAACSAP